MFIPWPAYIWLIFSSACVLYDFLYIYLRPLSFRFQPYEFTFEPYQIYQYFDTLKMNMNDRYLIIQNWLNLVEVSLILLTILLSWLPSKKLKFSSSIMLIVLSSFVFWKTVIYLWYDRPFITVSVHRMYSLGVVFYYCTIGLWIIFPLLTIYSISNRITACLSKNLVNL
jgi:hypothetical protein